MPTIDEVVASEPFGKPSAFKRGRNPNWPYVPVLVHDDRTEQVLGKAFKTRDEAVVYAGKVIDARRDHFRRRLLDPRWRALREQRGLPRELEAA